ncbi:peptidoglycan-binding protein [Streptomyces sp. NRRL F-4489]|uniref:LysM peptidoglycan-binding domain-containing protein n=1 Tax=Streptomyces sp. NRRL F-4489 TaxID=1609095 RepID=UPI00074A8CE3|nr:transglycosylase family protein [Streptomyces sp. NRRL F-4489]KUL37242.1 peptidoglycan-binding protein [Streptomyces sp. NRRL F-4489]
METQAVPEAQESPETQENRAAEHPPAGRAARAEAVRGRGARSVTAAAVLLAAGALGVVSEEPAEAVSGTTWDRLAQCESGGNWRTDTGNGFSGGLQFGHSTWHSFGGRAYAPRASRASRAQQIQVAERVLARQGWGAWPACAASLGLRGIPRGGGTPTLPAPRKAAPAHPRTARQKPHRTPYEKPRHRDSGGTVVVNTGDTLSGIGAVHGKPWEEIYRQNRQVIGADPNLIYPGTRLTVHRSGTE